MGKKGNKLLRANESFTLLNPFYSTLVFGKSSIQPFFCRCISRHVVGGMDEQFNSPFGQYFGHRSHGHPYAGDESHGRNRSYFILMVLTAPKHPLRVRRYQPPSLLGRIWFSRWNVWFVFLWPRLQIRRRLPASPFSWLPMEYRY